jgi:hypothetical protein
MCHVYYFKVPTFSLKILLRVLREEQNASLSTPSHEYMIKLGVGWDCHGASLHERVHHGNRWVTKLGPLKKMQKPIPTFFWSISSWLQWMERMLLLNRYLLFLLSNLSFLQRSPLLSPWWHNCMECNWLPWKLVRCNILDRAKEFIFNLPFGLWVLGDGAFPRIPGRLEKVRKKGEHLPSSFAAASFQESL